MSAISTVSNAIALSQATIAALQAMASTLLDIAGTRHGGDRPNCPILADLAGPAAALSRPGASVVQPGSARA